MREARPKRPLSRLQCKQKRRNQVRSRTVFEGSQSESTKAREGIKTCRHSFFPFFEGTSQAVYAQATLADYASKTVTYNGKEMPPRCSARSWALKAAGLDNSEELARVKGDQARMRDFVKQTGLRRQPVRESVIKSSPKSDVDPDLQRAQQGRLFSLQSKDDEVISSKPIDLSSHYGNDKLRSDKIILAGNQKRYIRREHPTDKDWLNQNPGVDSTGDRQTNLYKFKTPRK